jgi:DNA-binding Lrp family transcriptional regulator
VLTVNSLDKALLWELFGNARISFQNLAKKYKRSFNTIKNRVKKLEKIGAIQEYTVELSLAMLDLESIFIDITTDGSEIMEELMDQIGNHQSVRLVYRPRHCRYQARAYVSGTREFFELKSYLEKLQALTKFEIHPTYGIAPDAPKQSKARSRGQKVTFTSNQLRVLKCLMKDVRMPISEIARQTGLSSRQVSKIICELQDEGGVHLTIRMNYLAFGDVELELFIRFDDSKTTAKKIVEWFLKHYPTEFWVAAVWEDEPTVDVMLIIENPSYVNEIMSKVRETDFVESVEDQLVPPQIRGGHYRDPTQHRLEKMFQEAGL